MCHGLGGPAVLNQMNELNGDAEGRCHFDGGDCSTVTGSRDNVRTLYEKEDQAKLVAQVSEE